MLDIHPVWFLVLLVNFLGLLFVLNLILFKPLLKVFNEREDTVKGSLNAAKEMSLRKEEGIERLTREMSGARGRAKEVFDGLREEGLKAQKEMLQNAESQAASMLQQGREELRTEAEKARHKLKADIEKFSDEIVGKLVRA